MVGFFYIYLPNIQIMKLKFIGLTVLSLVVFACASKSAVATAPPPPPEAPAPAKVLTAEAAAGKDLYQNNCAKCHKLFAPSEFSKEDWGPILVRMQPKARLDDSQMANISNYIYSQL